MLKDRKLIGIVADVVEQTINQRLTDLPTRNAHRSGDGESSLIARHSRYQVLTVVYCFRQTLELSAVAEKVRTHSQHDVDREVALLCCFEQEFYECACFVRAAAFVCGAEPKQLFKLIHHNQQLLVFTEPRHAPDIDDP